MLMLCLIFSISNVVTSHYCFFHPFNFTFIFIHALSWLIYTIAHASLTTSICNAEMQWLWNYSTSWIVTQARRNPIFCLLWLILLVFLAWPLAFAMGALWILLQVKKLWGFQINFYKEHYHAINYNNKYCLHLTVIWKC